MHCTANGICREVVEVAVSRPAVATGEKVCVKKLSGGSTRNGEIRMIQHIEYFEPELDVDLFAVEVIVFEQ